MDVRLNAHEATLLGQALRQYVSDMALEIGKTENYDWRQSLKADQETLEHIIERVDGALAGTDEEVDAVVVVVETRVVG